MPRSKAEQSERKVRRAKRMARKREQTQREILDAAIEVILERGIKDFTVDEVARALGVTKPAIYYYFDSKDALLHELVATQMREESEVMCAAVDAADTGAEALGAAIRAFVGHYRKNLRMFRLAYLYSQIAGAGALGLDAESAKTLVHPHTSRFYGALEAKLLADRERGELAPDVHPRRLAVIVHSAALGLMAMLGVTEAAGDPMKHSDEQLVDEMVRSFVEAARVRSP